MSEAVSGGSVPFSLGNFSPDRGFTSGPQQLVSMGYNGFYPASQLAGVDGPTDQVEFKNAQAAHEAGAVTAAAPKKSISFGEMAINFIKGATVDTVKQVFEQLTTLPGLVMTGLAIGAVALIGAPAAIALAAIGLAFVGLQTLQNGGKMLSAFSSGDGEQANEAARGFGNVLANLTLLIAGGAKGIEEGAPVTIKGKNYRLDPTVAKKGLSPFESFGVLLKSLFGKVKYIEEGTTNELPFHKALWQAGREQVGTKMQAARSSIQERWPSSLKRSSVKLEGTETERLQAFVKLAQEDKAPISQKFKDLLKAKESRIAAMDETELTVLAEEIELNSKLHLQAQQNALKGGAAPLTKGTEQTAIRQNLLSELELRNLSDAKAQQLRTYIIREEITPSRYKAIRQELEGANWKLGADEKTLQALQTNAAEHVKLLEASPGTALESAQQTTIRQNLLKDLENRTFNETDANKIKTLIQKEGDLTLEGYQDIRKQLEAKPFKVATDSEAVKTIKTNTTQHNELLDKHQTAQAKNIQESLNTTEESYKDTIAPEIRRSLRGQIKSTEEFKPLLDSYANAQTLLQRALVNQGIDPQVAKAIALKPDVVKQPTFEAQVSQAMAELSKTYSKTAPDKLTARQITEVLTQQDIPVKMNPFSKQYYETVALNAKYPGALPIVAGGTHSFLGLLGYETDGPSEAPAH